MARFFTSNVIVNVRCSIGWSVLSLLAVIGIVFTFLPDQKVGTVESTEWMVASDDVAQKDQQLRSVHSWQKTSAICLASFTFFYQLIIEAEDKLTASFTAYFKRQHLFTQPNHYSPRLIYPVSGEELPDFLLS